MSRNLQGRQHRLPCVRLDAMAGKGAGEDLPEQSPYASKSRGCREPHPTFRERQERRIGYGYGAPFLRRIVLRLGRTRRLTRERGVREIIQRDDRRPVEQRLDRADPMVLACLFMFEQRIRRPIQGPVTEGAEVDAEPFSGSAARTVHVRSPAWVALSRSIPRSRLRPPPRAVGLQPVNAQPGCRVLRPSAQSVLGRSSRLRASRAACAIPIDHDRARIAVLKGLDSDPLPVTRSPSGVSDRCS